MSCTGYFVLSCSLLHFAIRWAHGQDHCARGEVIKRLQAVWWSPILAATVGRTLHECDVFAQYNTQKNFPTPVAHIPHPDSPFRHLMIDYVDMTQQIGRMRYILACRFSSWIEATPTPGQDFSAKKFFNDLAFQIPSAKRMDHTLWQR